MIIQCASVTQLPSPRVIGLYKTEAIRLRVPCHHLEAVGLATLEWVECFNHRWLVELIGVGLRMGRKNLLSK